MPSHFHNTLLVPIGLKFGKTILCPANFPYNPQANFYNFGPIFLPENTKAFALFSNECNPKFSTLT